MNPLVLKLRQFTDVTGESEAALARLASEDVREAERGETLVEEGEAPRCAYLLLEGWAARYKTLADGREQISSFLVPGDFFDLNTFLISEMDHSVRAITGIKVATIKVAAIDALMEEHPRVAKGLLWQQLVLGAIEREWVVNMGRRSAYERVAHLFCEMYLRLRPIGLAEGGCYRFPVTQSDLADAVGVTAVHLNRVLQRLRGNGLVELRQGDLKIGDVEALKEVALFDATYLHLGAGAGQGERGTGRD